MFYFWGRKYHGIIQVQIKSQISLVRIVTVIVAFENERTEMKIAVRIKKPVREKTRKRREIEWSMSYQERTTDLVRAGGDGGKQ